MILQFKTHVGTEPTHFVEKITASLVFDLSLGKELFGYIEGTSRFVGTNSHKFKERVTCLSSKTKKHTIRKDKKDCWGYGANIHFEGLNQENKTHRFAPVIQVKSTQKIKLIRENGSFQLSIDGEYKSRNVMEEFAKNDGFNSIEELYEFLKGDFEGKIIHWTYLKY